MRQEISTRPPNPTRLFRTLPAQGIVEKMKKSGKAAYLRDVHRPSRRHRHHGRRQRHAAEIATSKVLHEVGGKPLLAHVIAAATRVVPASDIFAIIGHEADRVRAAVASHRHQFRSAIRAARHRTRSHGRAASHSLTTTTSSFSPATLRRSRPKPSPACSTSISTSKPP